VSHLTPAQTFGLLVGHRRLEVLGADFSYLLELAGLPALKFTRPCEWSKFDRAISELTDAVSSRASRIEALIS
jgi:hypothetical protein